MDPRQAMQDYRSLFEELLSDNATDAPLARGTPRAMPIRTRLDRTDSQQVAATGREVQ